MLVYVIEPLNKCELGNSRASRDLVEYTKYTTLAITMKLPHSMIATTLYPSSSLFLTNSTSSLLPHTRPPRSSVSLTGVSNMRDPSFESSAVPPAHSINSATGVNSYSLRSLAGLFSVTGDV